MDAEDKQKLDRILKLAEENNAYVRKMRNSQKTSQMFKAIYVIVVVAIVVAGFYYVKPYLSSVTDLYSSITGASGSAGSGLSLPSSAQIQDLVNQIKK